MSEASDNPGLDQLVGLWNSARRHRGWVFLGTVFLSLAGFAVIFLLPDRYRATTTILVDPQEVPEKYVSPTVNSDPAQRLNTITEQVLSSTRLQELIDEMRLYPELRGNVSREQLIDLMRKDVTVEVKQSSSAGLSSFTIAYVGEDPREVAQVANQLAATFIRWNLRSREQQAENTTEFLASQLKEAKQNLEEQERKVSAFKMQHHGEMPEQQASNLQTLAQLQTQFQANADALNRLDVERTLLTRGLEPAGGAKSISPAPVTERMRLEAERRQLKQQLLELQRRYTAAHPEVSAASARLQLLEEKLKTLPPDPTDAADSEDSSAVTVRLQLLDREAKRLAQEQDRITAQIASYRTKVEAVPVREQEMAELDRNYSVSKEHYQSLLDKTFSAEMAADLERKQQAEHFTILDAAQTPERPFKPQRRLLMPVAFFAALAVSVGLAFVKDRVSGSPYSEHDLKVWLPVNVPLLATIPKLSDRADRRRAVRFGVLATLAVLSACALEVGLFLKLHPIL